MCGASSRRPPQRRDILNSAWAGVWRRRQPAPERSALPPGVLRERDRACSIVSVNDLRRAPLLDAAPARSVHRWRYLRLAGQVREAARQFRAGVEGIDGLHVTGDPVPGIFEIASPTLDMAAIGDVMDDRGWHLDRQQGGLHGMLSPAHVTVADQFVADLADAAAHHGPSRGVEARYGGGPS